MPAIKIAPLKASPQISAALSEILIEAVASGGSVSFMHPLAQQTADSFWRIRWLRLIGASASFSARLTETAWSEP